MRFPVLSKRAFVRIVSFGAAGVITLGGFCFMGWQRAAVYRRTIEYDYRNAFQNLVDAVTDIDAALQKSGCSNSPPMLAALAGEVSRKAYGAQADMGALPSAFAELESTARFLAQLGDYAYCLGKQAARGEPLSPEQTEEMRRLSETAGYLSSGLTALMTIAGEEDLDIGRVLAASKLELSDAGGFSRTMRNAGERFSEMPELIYDGPFSDHINKQEAEFIRDKPEIDRAAAASRAAEYLGVQPALLRPMGEIAGAIPSYHFKTVLEGGEVFISVSRQGGYCVTLINSRNIAEPKIGFDDAVQKAREYLAARGFDGMKETYYTRSGNTLLINFAYNSGGVTYYTDLIKVGVALDNGKIQLFDAGGYIMCHGEREPAEPSVTIDGAKAALSPDLFVSGAELCVIPSDGLNEVLCYGFTCVDKDSRTYLIYVNANTGFEERILIVLEDENGTLTI